MKPYYSEKGIEIFHGDCREVLPELGIYDLLLTDPPYGIGTWHWQGGNSITKEQAEEINKWDIRPSADTLKLCLRSAVSSIVWGGNYFSDVLGAWRTPLVWDKQLRNLHIADGEIAWTNFDFGALRVFSMAPANGDCFGKKEHPTQKPLALMKWCMNFVPQAKTVLDPFCGSGSTLRAAKDLGKQAVGIEIQEKYAAIAAKRLSQGVLEL